jgi:NAD(P)-dependent dehydrogenase (short-subunit alcohol dehydrogenase family)
MEGAMAGETGDVSADRGATSSLAGKAALVTGGTSGIGLAVVRRFAASGAAVVAVARKARPEVADAGARLLECDVSDESQMAAAFERATELVGALDVVVLNAGISALDHGALEGMSVHDVWEMLSVNTMGVFHGLKHAPWAMNDGGSIILTSTATLQWAFPDYMAYSASKAALPTMCKHAAMKLGRRGIRVNTVSPGTILTGMQPADDDEARICAIATCLGRVGRPEDVAGAYHFLASDDSRYITGTDLRVDGGWIEGLTYAEAEEVLRSSREP